MNRFAYKSLIENTTVGGLHLGERHANERGEDRDKNVFVGASVRILRRPNNYIPRVVPRRPSPRVRVSFGPGASPRPVLYSVCAILRTRLPPGKFRYTRRRTVTREIKAAPFTCPAFQYVSILSSTDLAPDSAFDFAREGVAATSRVLTFQFVPSGLNLRTTLEIYAVLAGASPRGQKNLGTSATLLN